MRKGFIFTLLTIAFALVQVTSTFAVAPITNDKGDIIVGDLENATNPATGTNIFVYPQAVDLDSLVSDDATPDDEIKWSFFEASGDITINGVSSLGASLAGLNADDPTSPRASSRLDLNDNDPGEAGGSSNQDSNARTLTIRNSALSPDNNSPATIAAGDIGTELSVRTVTLFASDCSTFSSGIVTVHTIDNTSDSMSAVTKETIIAQIDFATDGADAHGWAGAAGANTSGQSAVSSGMPGSGGMCMTGAATAAPGDDSGWFAANPYWDLADNTVYCITLGVTSDQTTAGAQPFWDLSITNNPASLYGTQYWVLDTDGSANAIQAGGSTFRYAWAPASVGMPRWSAFLGTGAGDAAADPSMLIRMIDANADIGFAADSGTICITSLLVEAIDRSSIAVDAVEEGSTLDPSTHFAEAVSEVGVGNDPTVPVGGPITFNPDTTGGALGADTNDRHTFGYFNVALGATNVPQALNPIVQQSQTLYRGVIGAVATGGTDITDGPDVLFVNGTPTAGTEFAVSSFVTRGAGATEGVTSPGAVAGVYEAYLFVQAASASPTADNDRMNFAGQWTNTDTLFGGGNGGDDVDVTSLTMERLVNIFN
jgi:hypothetical protein